MQHPRSLTWNAAANYIGLGYTTIIGIIVFPLYLQYLGPESFGLVGFFILLQSWAQLLDMGMSPLLSRQAAKARGLGIEFIELKKLLRSLELIFFVISLVVVISISAASEWIAASWLNAVSLSFSDVKACVILMGIIIVLRFFSSLYRSGIQGMENQVWLNVSGVVLATVRFVGVLLVLQFITQDIVSFFVYQLIVSVIELTVLSIMFYHSMPLTEKLGINFFWGTLKPTLPFAGGLAYSVVIWVLLTQLDKMVLSSVLSLSEYGYFALVAVIATGISQVSGPISQAILPRMTYLLSQGNNKDMLILYRRSTQIMVVIVLPLTGMIALFSTELLFAWTGDRAASDWAGPILFWFALGNGILAMNAFQYYLQFAYGKLKIHVIYNTVLAIVQIPLIIYVALEYGALAVAQVWFILRLIAFILWTPIVHHMFVPGLHFPWLLKDIAPAFLLTTLLLMFIQSLNIGFDSMSRLEIFSLLTVIAIMVLIVNIVFSTESRKLVMSMIQAIKLK